MDDGDADVDVDNRLSLVVLLAVSSAAIFTIVTDLGRALPIKDSASSQAYPIVVALREPGLSNEPILATPVGSGQSIRSVDAGESRQGAFLHRGEATSQGERSRPDGVRANLEAGIEQTASRSQSASPFLVSDFNLGSIRSGSNAIEIEKPVLINGRIAGKVHLRIDSAAEIFVRRDDLKRIAGGKIVLQQGDNQEFVALEKIRDLGIVIRYNAGQDALSITT